MQQRRHRWLGTLLVVVATAMVSCSKPGPAPVTVFAAASLAAPFSALATAFETSPGGCQVRLHTDGSQNLVLQLREGASADVFAVADERTMQRVVDLGRVYGAPRVFARNSLAIMVEVGNQHHIQGLADLARSDLKVALCGPTVPVGNYARKALETAGVTVHSVSDETSVKALVGKVQLGEVDAVIAYQTDVRTGLEAIAIPPEHNVIASYPIAVLTARTVDGNHDRAAAEAFVAFVLSPAGRAVLQEHGFALP
jgi:molybdate transport system substrate-binding protein